MQAHREGGGWTLLEETLECNDELVVAEGYVEIDGATVVEVGYDCQWSQQLRGVYPAMNWGTKVAWTTSAPALGDNWTALVWNHTYTWDTPVPCIYVQVHTSSSAMACIMTW